MNTRLARWSLAALLLAVLLEAPPARADIAPEPSRPTWNEHPAPAPEPPPEKQIAWMLAMLLGLGGLGVASLSPRLRARRRAPLDRRS